MSETFIGETAGEMIAELHQFQLAQHPLDPEVREIVEEVGRDLIIMSGVNMSDESEGWARIESLQALLTVVFVAQPEILAWVKSHAEADHQRNMAALEASKEES